MRVDRAFIQESIVPIVSPFISRERIRRLLLGLMWSILLLVGGWMAVAYLLPQNLRNTGFFYGLAVCASFFGRVFQFHLAIAIGAIALIALFMRARYLAAIGGMFAFLLLCPTVWSMAPSKPPAAGSGSIRLMSANLLCTNQNGGAILYQIRKANPDVIAIQEYSNWDDELLKRELTDYPYRLLEPQPDSTGVALYSKLPMSAEYQEPHNAMGTRPRLRATLQIDGHNVVLYAIHPSSPHRYSNILRNRLQTADLIDAIKTETLPVIVAGDFNATETTPNLQAYSAIGFRSTQDLAGFARGSTWPAITWLQHLPGVRIDHILIGPELTCTHAQVCGPTGSDHRPLMADIAYSQK